MSLELEREFEVRVCSSGEDAIQVVDEWAPEIVLLDVMMPVKDGPTTLLELKEKIGSGLPKVLFCTARAQSSDIDRYLSLGASGVISKPFDPMTLASTVKEYLK